MSKKPAHDYRQWIRSAVDQFERPLCRYAARIVGDVDRARDVVQETFLRLCRQPPGSVNGHLAQWLFTVCRNQAVDSLRAERGTQSLSHDDESQVENLSYQKPQVGNLSYQSPPEIVERAESAGRAVAMLAGLPDRQQEAIRLKFEAALSYREIAEVMDTTVSNVGVLIHEGIKTMRKKLSAEA